MTDTKTPKSAMTHTVTVEVPMGVSIITHSPTVPRELTIEVREVWDFFEMVKELEHVASKLTSL